MYPSRFQEERERASKHHVKNELLGLNSVESRISLKAVGPHPEYGSLWVGSQQGVSMSSVCELTACIFN